MLSYFQRLHVHMLLKLHSFFVFLNFLKKFLFVFVVVSKYNISMTKFLWVIYLLHIFPHERIHIHLLLKL